MRLPTLDIHLDRTQNLTDTFRGLNQNIICNTNEWRDMKNISSRFYPGIGTRKGRGAVEKTFTAPKGIFYKNKLFYIDGTNAYYNGVSKFTVSNSKKTIVGIGAYICVFPDKKMYNTFTDTVENMEAALTQSATFAPASSGSSYTKITSTGIGNSFKKGDNVKISECSNADYNGIHIILDAGTNYIQISGVLENSFTDSSVKFERLVPDMDFVCERDNRLWGCSSANHEVYCCKIGDPKNWYNYETEANNSWAATVGSDGDFTGISKFGTYLIFFKEQTFHVLRGDKPSNFSLLEKDQPGVRTGCGKSIQSIQQTLYYVGTDGVYAYTGAIPQKISRNITGEITEAVASQFENKLFVSCKLNGVQKLLVYDPETSIWDIEDDTLFKFAEYSGGKLHYVGSDNKLREIYGDETQDIEWYLETGDLNGGSLNQKYVAQIQLNLWLAVGSEFTVFIKYDDGPLWERKGMIRCQKNKTYTFAFNPIRCAKYRLRFEGKGQMKLLGMSQIIERGSELNGNIYSSHRK